MRALGFAIALYALVATSCADSSCNCPTAVNTSVLVFVVDATSGENVAAPVFSENGKPLLAVCGDEDDAGSCAKWEINLSTAGTHTISVSAPGETSQTFDVLVTSYTGQCGCKFINDVTPVHLTLSP